MAQFTLDETQDGARVNLQVGDVVVLRLAENPTTGYRWDVVAAQGLELEADDFVSAAGAGSGGGGQRALRFKANAVGTSQLETVLRRSWSQEPAQKRFTITLAIR